MRIIKFGGAAITDRSTYEILLKFISDSKKSPTVYVISAFSKTSSILKQASKSALSNNYKESEKLVDSIADFHTSLIHNYNITSDVKYDFIANFKINVKKILKGVAITSELTSRISDRILSLGEDLAVETIKTGLNNPDIQYIDSRRIIITNNNYGMAEPIIELSRTKSLNVFNKLNNPIIITQGFVASAENGDTTTMGFESSNLTATLLADFLNASELTIYTNVDGIYNIDPKKFQPAALIKNIDYGTAIKAANYGLKLIYPQMINLAKDKNIKVYYKNALNFDNNNFTTISNFPKTDEFLIITNKPDLFLNSFSKYDFSNEEYTQINIINYEGKYFNFILDLINKYNKSGFMKFLIQSPEAIRIILCNNDTDKFCNELLNVATL